MSPRKTAKRAFTLHGLSLTRHAYPARTRRAIAESIKPVSEPDADTDFARLRAFDSAHDDIGLRRVGNKSVDRFTYAERLSTTGNKGISFYDFYFNRNKFVEKPYVARALEAVARETRSDANPPKAWIRVFTLYFGSVNIFRPLVACKIYALFRPTHVLDPCAGWGGRLAGAAAMDVPRYTGIDSNTRLREPYRKLTEFLATRSDTKARMIFKDALAVDFSKIDYDMVLTSPPYYDIERYGADAEDASPLYTSRDEWNTLFYRPLFEKTFAAMRAGGYFCLNVPPDIYNSVCLDVLGAADAVLAFQKKARPNQYAESIYVWRKGGCNRRTPPLDKIDFSKCNP
jgi:tRNA1(Val) A37 N6-methylase TrmN6